MTDLGFDPFNFLPNASSPAAILEGVTLTDIQNLMEENSSLRGYLQGYIAEMMLKRKLLSISDITSVEKIPDRNSEKGDLRIMYRGKSLTMEVKSLATASVRPDPLNETWQGSVMVKNTDKRILNIEGLGPISSTSILKGGFDILAICCFAIRGNWDFVFIESRYLPEVDMLPGLVQTKFLINPSMTACLVHDPVKILDAVHSRKP